MAKPLTLFTRRAADAIQQQLKKAMPIQPILSSDNDQNLIKLNDMLDALNDDIDDLTECFHDLKKSTEKLEQFDPASHSCSTTNT